MAVFHQRQHRELARMFCKTKPEPQRDEQSRTRLDQWVEMVSLFEAFLAKDSQSFDPTAFRQWTNE